MKNNSSVQLRPGLGVPKYSPCVSARPARASPRLLDIASAACFGVPLGLACRLTCVLGGNRGNRDAPRLPTETKGLRLKKQGEAEWRPEVR